MSHYGVLVLVHPKAHSVEEQVSIALEPFDENKTVPLHNERCHCVGDKAFDEIRAQMTKEFGEWHEIRDTFQAKLSAMNPRPSDEVAQQMWQEVINPVYAKEKELKRTHPLKDSPASDCDSCKGTGQRPTTSNPKGKWDWFMIGGCWTGTFTNYKPSENPENQETCWICKGCGRRNDEVGLQLREQDPKFTCNGCSGTGVQTKWPTEWKRFAGDVMPLASLNKDELCKTFHAILTPDGNWHEQGHMGWFGVVNDEMPMAEWEKHFLEVLEKYIDHTAVVVDCHS